MKFLLAAVSLLVLGACDDDGVNPPANRGPTAAMRFVNLARDVGPVDFRFVDQVENMPSFMGVGVRGSSGVYQGLGAGNRHTRVFPNNDTLAVTSIILKDTMLSLTANSRYTFVYAGREATGEDRLVAFEDPATLAAPEAGQIALKALHGAHGTGAVDVYIVPVASATAATPVDFQTTRVAVLQNVGYLTQTQYVNVPARPTTGTPLYRFVVTEAGSATQLFATTPNVPGAPSPEGATYGPNPGVQIAGSVLTIVIAPATDPDTRGAAAANSAPGVFLLIDKALDPVPPPAQ